MIQYLFDKKKSRGKISFFLSSWILSSLIAIPLIDFYTVLAKQNENINCIKKLQNNLAWNMYVMQLRADGR